MSWFRLQRLLRVWVLTIYALAVAATGFAHGQPSLQNPRPDLTAYVLPDGSLPTICYDGDTTGGSSPAASFVCDACLLSAAPGLPVCTAEPQSHPRRTLDVAYFPLRSAPSGQLQRYVPHLRGPPKA